LNVVGDSKNTIRYFVTKYSPKDVGLKIQVECIRISFLNLNVQLYHVYRQINIEADAMENKPIGLTPSLLGIDAIQHVVTPL
jgi:hypothetical protein